MPALSDAATRLPEHEQARTWPDDRIARLRERWVVDRVSASVIAGELGVSRCAVLSKVWQLGLRGGTESRLRPRLRFGLTESDLSHRHHQQHEPNAKLTRANVSAPIHRRAPAEANAQPGFLALRFDELADGQCRYPRGSELPYLFCGKPVENHRSYCAFHRHICCPEIPVSAPARELLRIDP